MNTDFPKSEKQFLKASIFQDQEIPLVYKGWSKKANEDRVKDGAVQSTWKQNLKFALRYSYPEFALDEAGDKIMKEGKPLKNRNFDAQFPHGYSILYHFEEGQLESGSLPLFNAFCLVRPQPGETLTIKRTGKDQETKWTVRKLPKNQVLASTSDIPERDINDTDYTPDEHLPF